MERVQILSYDPIKGKGNYAKADGGVVPFRYTDFNREAMIPPGPAFLHRGKLHPAPLSRWQRFVDWWRRL